MYRHVDRDVRTILYLCIDTCVDMSVDMCVDMSVDMCVDMCVDTCKGMCIGVHGCMHHRIPTCTIVYLQRIRHGYDGSHSLL